MAPQIRDRTLTLPGANRPVAKTAGHWLLASVGKTVLRPGGRETTHWLLDHIGIPSSTVVEFAAGLGITAREVLDRGPRRYIGVDSDAQAVTAVSAILPAGDHQVIEASAEHTSLRAGCADAVLGEAMLTMHTDRRKLEIMREAARLLRPGGVYAIHEMGLTPDDLSPGTKDEIRTALARSIRVNARPLTIPEWIALADEAGFQVIDTYCTSMSLLDPRRMIADEGLLGTVRIIGNVLRRPEVRRRVLAMRRVFTTHRDHLLGVGIILTRTSD